MRFPTSAPSGRRSFLGMVGAVSGLAILRPLRALGAEPAARVDGPWDLSWLDGLKGKHRQVFDVGSIEGLSPLHVVKNYLNAHHEVYGLAYPKINTVVGIAGRGFPINASDPIWAKYELGKRWKVNDPATGTWAVRNIFAGAPVESFSAPANSPEARAQEMTMRALQARGTIFWQCNNALNGVVQQLAAATNTPVDAVRTELVAGLMPGVHIVPAHTMAIGLSQEHGCTYESL